MGITIFALFKPKYPLRNDEETVNGIGDMPECNGRYGGGCETR